MKFTAKQIKESRKAALEKIKQFLEAENVDEQFADKTGAYYSSDKFIVVWIGYWNGIPSEYSIYKCDGFYTEYSGYKFIYVINTLFQEKLLAGYTSIERALIEVGMKLCCRDEKRAFFEKYATKYNARLQKEREQQQ